MLSPVKPDRVEKPLETAQTTTSSVRVVEAEPSVEPVAAGSREAIATAPKDDVVLPARDGGVAPDSTFDFTASHGVGGALPRPFTLVPSTSVPRAAFTRAVVVRALIVLPALIALVLTCVSFNYSLMNVTYRALPADNASYEGSTVRLYLWRTTTSAGSPLRLETFASAVTAPTSLMVSLAMGCLFVALVLSVFYAVRRCHIERERAADDQAMQELTVEASAAQPPAEDGSNNSSSNHHHHHRDKNDNGDDDDAHIGSRSGTTVIAEQSAHDAHTSPFAPYLSREQERRGRDFYWGGILLLLLAAALLLFIGAILYFTLYVRKASTLDKMTKGGPSISAYGVLTYKEGSSLLMAAVVFCGIDVVLFLVGAVMSCVEQRRPPSAASVPLEAPGSEKFTVSTTSTTSPSF